MIEVCHCGGVPHQITIRPVFYSDVMYYEVRCEVCGFTCQHPYFENAVELWNEYNRVIKSGIVKPSALGKKNTPGLRMNQSPGARRPSSPRYYYTTFPVLCQAPGVPGYGERQKDRPLEPRSPEGGGGG